MPSPQIPAWRWLVVLFALTLGLGVALGFLSSAFRQESPAMGALVALIVASLFVFIVWLSALYWRRLDEAAREAHKWAWFWGGNVALVPLVAVFLILVERPNMNVPVWPGFEATPAGYLATGGVAVIFALMVGYSLAWVFWWFWKSR